MKPSEFPPILAAEHFIAANKNKFLTINEKEYEYQGELYKEVEEDYLKNKFINFLNDNELGKFVTETYIRSMLLCFRALKENESITVNECQMLDNSTSCIYIPVNNGILCITRKENTFQRNLINYNRMFFTTNKIKTDYVSDLKAVRFLKLLDEIVPDKAQQLFLQEYIGYSLTRDTSQNTMCIIYGPGANGKSAFLTALKEVFGDGAYDSLTITDLQGRENYKMAKVENRFINICDEIPEDKKISTDKIKNITSGGELIVREIYKSPKKIKAYFKLLFCSNCLPRFTDKSDAIFRRLVIINFPNQFLTPDQQDKRLITSQFWNANNEKEGILNWALEGLERLIERGHFIEPEYSQRIKHQYRLDLNPERQFILENVEFSTESQFELPTLELYKKYERHCMDYGINKRDANVFGQEVRRAFPNVGKTNPKMNRAFGKKVRSWVGIRLIPEGLEQVELVNTNNQSSK